MPEKKGYGDTTTGGTGRLVTVEYDGQAKASYQRMSDLPVAYTREMWEGVFYDYAENGSVVGIERLYA